MDDYKYDVFLSYSNSYPYNEWICECFLPLFEGYLREELGRKDIKIFLDRYEIRTGDDWRNRLRNSLVYSRCLVGIFTRTYFASEWCRRECAVMLHRERQYQFRSLHNPNGLILGVQAHDGEFYPDIVTSIQQSDFRRLVRLGEGFKRTEKYVELQDKIQYLAADVALSARSAPPWKPEWLTPDFLDCPDHDLLPKPSDNFSLPALS